jgi:AAA ATPase domain/Protein kinase domain
MVFEPSYATMLTLIDPAKIMLLRRAYTIMERIHADKVIIGISLPRYWNDSPTAMLTEYKNDHPITPGSLEIIGSVERFLDFAIQVTMRLSELHAKKVRHGAIRPESFTISPDGKIRLQDFTCASLLFTGEQPSETWAETEYLPYLPPESTGRINRRVDYRADFYSLGATLHHILTGQPLWGPGLDELEIANKHVCQIPPSANFHPSIDAVIAKLLHKMPEERYQTCEGLLSDWKDIQANPDAEFIVGATDKASRFVIPPSLYGRDAERQQIIRLYDQVRQEQSGKLVFIKGCAGGGKSALVKDVLSTMHYPQTLVCQGRFEQKKRLPFSAIVQALESLTSQILTQSTSNLEDWRNAIRDALGDELIVLLQLIPDVAHVVGMSIHDEIPSLGNSVTKERRQKRVLMRLLRVFAENKTIVMFIDNLEWALKADLQLLADLVQDFSPSTSGSDPNSSEVTHSVLLICADRGDATGPLYRMRTLFEDKVLSDSIEINSLNYQDSERLICDTLHCSLDECKDLSQLIYLRTRGNPMFIHRVHQLLSLLI